MEFIIQNRANITDSNFIRCMSWVANYKLLCSVIVPKYVYLNFPKLFHETPCIMGDFVWRLIETKTRLPKDQVQYITVKDIKELFLCMPDNSKDLLLLVRAGITSC